MQIFKKKKYNWSKRKEIIFLAIAFWTFTIIFSFFWNVYQAKDQILALADNEAKVNLQRDLALRRWATGHGGIYVTVSEKAKPNQYLAHMKERDIKTPSGETLTLFNPATIMREIKKTQEELFGAVAKLTALQVLNPINLPDEWEKKALGILQNSREDYTELTEINGKPYLRKMQPMFMEEGCMKCHAWTGLKVGELRGATDYSVSLEPYYQILHKSEIKMFFSHMGIWLFGFAIIVYLAKRNKEAMLELEESDETNQSLTGVISKIIDNSPVGILLYEAVSGKCVIANNAAAKIIGGNVEKLLDQNYLTLTSLKESGLFDAAKIVIETGEDIKKEFHIKTSFGKDVWVECVLNAFENHKIPHLLLIISDITQRKQADVELRKLLTAIEQSPTSILISDVVANIQYANPRFCEITGYSIEDIIGKNPRILSSGLTPKSTYVDLWEALTNGKNWSGELVNKRKNGEIYFEQAYISPVRDSIGKISYYVAVKLDITERKKMELALVKSKEEAEKANKAKSDFLATMSHEIRTPIHGMLGFNEILMDSNPRNDQLSQLKTIAENGNNLLDIINNILNIAELEKDNIPLITTEFSLKELLDETCLYYTHRINGKSVTLECNITSEIEYSILSDKRRIEQIIHNLIENAIKFTEKGVISFDAKSELITNEECKLTLSIADTGKGITEENKEKIFELFSQEDTSISRKFGGLGLGLAICKRLTSLLGGDIQVESTIAKGSKFTFTILCKALPTHKKEIISTISISNPLDNIRILIAEDDVINTMIIQQYLKSLGYIHVEEAEDGEIALKKFTSKHFDLILTDLHMPNMNGFELAINIQKEFKSNMPKIIAITADAYEETRQKCFSLGMAGFMTKPFTRDQLADTIKKVFIS